MTIKEQKPIVSAIIIAGVLIAGAVLLKGSHPPSKIALPDDSGTQITGLAPVSAEDRVLGDANAKVTVVMYEDFQCPFCEKLFQESEKNIRDNYVQAGEVQLVYRDFAFLGPESQKSAEAARCAGDQGKFWEYHDFLFENQGSENSGHFSDTNLKSFARSLSLNTDSFNSCLDGGKYTQAVLDQKDEGGAAGVSGTPKGYILRDGKITGTIDGAEPYSAIKAKIDAALK